MSPKTKKVIGSKRPMDVEELEFVACVDLKEPPKPRKGTKKIVYHGIYASQLYGTLFAIYGKFYTDEKAKAGCCLVSGVNLKLLNYKGFANIGFPEKTATVNTNATNIVIDFNVQAMLTNNELDIKFTTPIEVNLYTPKRILFRRTLLALPKFEVDPASGTKLSALQKPRKASVPSTPYFDTEFHYRDGVDYYDSVLRDGMDGFNTREIFSFRCVQSNVNLVYY